MISVIMPVYNKEKHVVDSINSVLQQSFSNFELIIVFDLSTDRSSELVMQHLERNPDPRVRLMHTNSVGPGGYAARNLGAGEARYKWLAFLDADDIWEQGHLLELVQLIEADSRCRFASTSWKELQGPASRAVYDLRGYLGYEINAKERLTLTSACFIRKELFNAVGGFPQGKIVQGGDVNLWFRAICFDDYFVKILKKTVTYRVGVPGQVSGSSIIDPTYQFETAKSAISNITAPGLRFMIMKWSNQLVCYAWASNIKKSALFNTRFDLYKCFFWRAASFRNILFIILHTVIRTFSFLARGFSKLMGVS